MKDRANMIWSEINSQQFVFDRQRIELIELEKVTLDDTVELFKTLIAPLAKKRKRLSIHVLSTADGGAGTKSNEADKAIIEDVEKKAVHVDNVIDWKQTLELYPTVHSWAGKAKL